MPITQSDLWAPRAEKFIEVTPPGKSGPVLLRYPTFSEWHEIMVGHAKLEKTGEPPSVALITKTIAYTLSDQAGNRRLTDQEAKAILDADPGTVMWIYKKAGQTVLKNDDQTLGELEGNSEASRE